MCKLMIARQVGITAIRGSRSSPAFAGYRYRAQGCLRPGVRPRRSTSTRARTPKMRRSGLRTPIRQPPNGRSAKTDRKAKERRAGLTARKRHDEGHTSTRRLAGRSSPRVGVRPESCRLPGGRVGPRNALTLPCLRVAPVPRNAPSTRIPGPVPVGHTPGDLTGIGRRLSSWEEVGS